MRHLLSVLILSGIEMQLETQINIMKAEVQAQSLEELILRNFISLLL